MIKDKEQQDPRQHIERFLGRFGAQSGCGFANSSVDPKVTYIPTVRTLFLMPWSSERYLRSPRDDLLACTAPVAVTSTSNMDHGYAARIAPCKTTFPPPGPVPTRTFKQQAVIAMDRRASIAVPGSLLTSALGMGFVWPRIRID
jgi:hypothetical protein